MWKTILLGLTVVLIYFKVIRPRKYWDEKVVASLKPWPIVGNMGSLFFKQRSLAHLIQDIYNSFPGQRYVQFYQFLEPTIMVRDPSLIKQITVKDFGSFPEHQTFLPEGVDTLWDRILLASKEHKWHYMRGTLSPSFTGSKMKMMFGLVKDCARQVTNYLQKQETVLPIETKDAFLRYASDVIGAITMGIACDSFQNQENELFTMVKGLSDFSGVRGLVFFANSICPTAINLLKIKFIQPKISTFFRSIVEKTMKVREEKGINRPDILNLLVEARNSCGKQEEKSNTTASRFVVNQEPSLERAQKRQKAEITDEDILAQVMAFFVAGTDTSSALLSFFFYELALNPEIQTKLREEVDATLDVCNGDVTYEGLLGMKYLHMVVSESLRKWPPAEFTERQCVKEYTIEPELANEKPLRLHVGSKIWVPIYAIHRDPQYYPDPDKFDPERFNDENVKNIKPFSFLAFGAGPRKCIASRFAFLKAKCVIFDILSKFEVVPVEQTQIPVVLSKGGVNMITEKGIWLGFKPRKVPEKLLMD